MYKLITSIITTGAIVGFTNLGEVNSHLSEFEASTKDSDDSREPLANSMLVFMVRGLFNDLEFPYAQFPCTSLAGHQMYEIFWEAMSRLERCGFKACTLFIHYFSIHNSLPCILL